MRSPFASLVNTRYQSVHGVSISMKNPIMTSTFPLRKSEPRKYPNSGVHMKLTIRLVAVNFVFLKLSFSSFSGTSRNSPKSISHRDMFMRFPVFCAIVSMFENISPMIIAVNMIIGSSFSTKSIKAPFF